MNQPEPVSQTDVLLQIVAETENFNLDAIRQEPEQSLRKIATAISLQSVRLIKAANGERKPFIIEDISVACLNILDPECNPDGRVVFFRLIARGGRTPFDPLTYNGVTQWVNVSDGVYKT